MKKVLIATAAAMLAVGITQAITLGWSYGPVTATWTDDGSAMATASGSHTYRFFNGTGPASFSVATTLLLPAAPASGETELFRMAEWRSGNSIVTLTSDGNLRVRKETSNTVRNDYSVAATGEISVIFTYDFVGNTSDKTGKSTVITAYVNGIRAWSWSNDDVPPGTQIALSDAIYDNRETNGVSYTVYDGVLLDEQIAYLAENKLSLLPEPTALALLALGLAGAALRRRVR